MVAVLVLIGEGFKGIFRKSGINPWDVAVLVLIGEGFKDELETLILQQILSQSLF